MKGSVMDSPLPALCLLPMSIIRLLGSRMGGRSVKLWELQADLASAHVHHHLSSTACLGSSRETWQALPVISL